MSENIMDMVVDAHRYPLCPECLKNDIRPPMLTLCTECWDRTIASICRVASPSGESR